MEHIKAPDFPTGGVLYGYEGVKDAFHTGRGRIVMRAKATFEEVKGRDCIIVTEIPYQINKAEMIKKTAELVNDKKLEGIANIRDESDRNGMRIVYILKRGCHSEHRAEQTVQIHFITDLFQCQQYCPRKWTSRVVEFEAIDSSFCRAPS